MPKLSPSGSVGALVRNSFKDSAFFVSRNCASLFDKTPLRTLASPGCPKGRRFRVCVVIKGVAVIVGAWMMLWRVCWGQASHRSHPSQPLQPPTSLRGPETQYIDTASITANSLISYSCLPRIAHFSCQALPHVALTSSLTLMYKSL